MAGGREREGVEGRDQRQSLHIEEEVIYKKGEMGVVQYGGEPVFLIRGAGLTPHIIAIGLAAISKSGYEIEGTGVLRSGLVVCKQLED